MPEQVPFIASHAAGQRLAPAGLWRAVLGARTDVAHERGLSGQSGSSARVALVKALDSYVKSLAERGHPVPYALRDELRLQRRTCGATRL